MTKVDIVGGGLSRSSSAISMKELDKSINVIVYEKHKRMGYNSEEIRYRE